MSVFIHAKILMIVITQESEGEEYVTQRPGGFFISIK
jgi:hypothetical protein